jgi:transposase
MSHSTFSAQKFVDESTMIRANHIPVIARMCHKIGLIDLINESIPCNTELDLGTLVVGMVCDTLSGRSPLYKVEDFIKEQDTELLFGIPVDSHRFNDDALGNALDRIHQKGTLQLFTEVSLKAASIFNLDTSKCNFDTTSVNVWGDYESSKPGEKAPHITYGYSKDKRMDLKQFMVSMLCVEGNIPISGKMQNGNSSDEKLNNEELQRIGKLLSPLKDHIGDLIYVADCKLINTNNMKLLDDLLFISRFPGNFKEHNVAIENAIHADDWEELGILAETPSPSVKRQRANYRSHETSVTIGEKNYRALVIQTDHLDKRRTKGIENRKAKQKKLVDKKIKSAEKTTYHCQDDAQKALDIISIKKKTTYWNIKGSIEIIQVHAPGRAPKTGNRKIVDTKYKLLLDYDENTEHYQAQLKMAGCFVMICNISKEKMAAREVLKTYKEQYGVEQNFSFLKEPLIANDTFLKKPSRIDALTFILLVSLMIWNLIQRELRNSEEVIHGELKDLNKRPTRRPTSYLMMCQLSGTIILKYGNQRLLPHNGIRPQGLKYLAAMGFDETIYTTPPPRSKTQTKIQT